MEPELRVETDVKVMTFGNEFFNPIENRGSLIRGEEYIVKKYYNENSDLVRVERRTTKFGSYLCGN